MPEQRQDNDGQVYLAYYVAPFGFVWDGKADHIEVCHGGMGEPVVERIPFDPGTILGLRTAMQKFENACDRWIHDDEERAESIKPLVEKLAAQIRKPRREVEAPEWTI